MIKPNAILEIKKKNLIYNYNYLSNLSKKSICAATIKANAYGLGDKKIFKILLNQGCKHFFLATTEEALKIRKINSSNCSFIIFPSQEDKCSQINVKSYTTIHDLMHKYERRFKEYSVKEFHKRERIYKKICNFSNKIIVDSEIGKKHVIDSYHCKKKKNYCFTFYYSKIFKKI